MKTNWQTKKLSDVCFFQEGPGIRKYEYKKNGYPIINVRCVQDGYIDLSSAQAVDPKFIKEKWAHFQVEEGDILFTTSGTIGRTAMATKDDLPLLMNTSVVRFKSLNEKELDRYFLAWLLRSPKFIEEVKSYSSGTAQKNVGPTHLKLISISYPPLSEQKRIVKILDEASQKIEKVKENSEKNLRNSRELFESLLLGIFTNGIKIKKWGLERLERYSKVVVGYVGPISNEYTVNEKGVLLLSTKNINSKGITLDKLTRINKEFHLKNKKSQLLPGDIIVARHGNSGESAVIPDNIKEAHALNVIIIKKSSELSSDYLCFLLNSGILEKIKSSKAGSVQEIINTSVIKDLIIPVPTLPEQKIIVKKLDSLSEQTKKLEGVYEQKLADLEELKKSVLNRAFSGGL